MKTINKNDHKFKVFFDVFLKRTIFEGYKLITILPFQAYLF
jgi:hypothetical protein